MKIIRRKEPIAGSYMLDLWRHVLDSIATGCYVNDDNLERNMQMARRMGSAREVH